jgi:hypothetical protein
MSIMVYYSPLYKTFKIIFYIKEKRQNTGFIVMDMIKYAKAKQGFQKPSGILLRRGFKVRFLAGSLNGDYSLINEMRF